MKSKQQVDRKLLKDLGFELYKSEGLEIAWFHGNEYELHEFIEMSLVEFIQWLIKHENGRVKRQYSWLINKLMTGDVE